MKISPIWLILALVAAGALYVKDREAQAVARAQYAAKDSVRRVAIDSLERRVESIKVAYRRDTVRLRTWLTRWDTVKAGIDTLHDTTTVTVEVVREVVRTADSTVNACRVVVATCEKRAEAADSLASEWKARYELRDAQRGGFLRRHLSISLGYGAYLDGSAVKVGPGAAIGWRLWP